MKKYKLELKSILPLEHKSDYFPKYVFEGQIVEIGKISYFYYQILLNLIIRPLIKWRLKIIGSKYKKYDNDPHNKEVEDIYFREAETYEQKHHLTTNFRDTWWRRQVGLEIIDYINTHGNEDKGLNLLDIGTGIGLSLEEMMKMFKLFNTRVNAVGLDYNQNMLRQAERVIYPRLEKNNLLKKDVREVRFVRGDAMDLTGRNNSDNKEKLEYFSRDSFDCITTMFGIGGIDSHFKSIREQLAVLKLEGISIITDIHRPFVELEEKWPWFIRKKDALAFNILAWNKITKPLVLATLWGWRDPTPVFYLSSLMVDHDKNKNRYYGFEHVSLFLDNEPWWFNFPTISTAKIVLKKVEITFEEFEKRQKIINNFSF